MTKKKMLVLALVAIMAVTALAISGCGKKDSSGSTEPTKETTIEESQLASKAVEMNKDEENFYGKWKATSGNAENLYGYLEISINEDGTVIIDMTDEHLEGSWKKVDGGIHYSTELFEGDFFYGKKCRMVIREIEEDDNIHVTLTKVE